jgi:ABC-2 type transport system permease protein
VPIFDQGYQHWQGTLHSRFWRWWSIARRGAWQASKNRFTRLVLLSSLMPSLALSVLLALWGLVEQQASWMDLFLSTFGLPETIFSDPARLRNVVWTFAFHYFSIYQFFGAMVLVLLAGPDLISQDLRFNAIPLYFSKPIRRIDYFVGKLGVIGLLLSVVVFAPLILAYLLGVAFSLDVKVVRDTFPVLLGGLAYGAVIVVSAGTLMLAVSSVSRNTRTVGAIWVGIILVSNAISFNTYRATRNEKTQAISYPANLMRVGRELLGVPHAAGQLLDLQEDIRNQAGNVTMQRGPFGLMVPSNRKETERPPRANRPRRDPLPPTPPGQPERFGPLRYFHELASDPHPLRLSVWVLLGVFLASGLLLSSRVKSLDRLK